jgi:hypothetical protein
MATCRLVAPYLTADFKNRALLIVLRRIEGARSAENIADVVLQIIENMGWLTRWAIPKLTMVCASLVAIRFGASDQLAFSDLLSSHGGGGGEETAQKGGEDPGEDKGSQTARLIDSWTITISQAREGDGNS